MEDHDTFCDRCAIDLGPCDEPACIMRYAHAGGLCEACRAEEQSMEWEEA